jgi:4-hydroxy-tetrahydrodipicolinate synthase
MKSKSLDGFSGIIVATITPFRNSEVYKEGFTQLTDFLISKKVNAIFVCGTTGEGMIMNVKQRKKAAEIVVERSKKIPVIVHAGTNNIEETVELTKHAKDVGASAVAVITPMFYPYTNEGLTAYFSNVAKASDLPLFIYSNPTRTGIKMPPEVFTKIFQNGPDNLVGIKESSADMTYLGKIIQAVPGKAVFNGADTCFLPGLVLGTVGQVSGYATLVPELYVELYDAWIKGDVKLAQSIQTKISKIKACLETPYIQPIKEGLKMRSIDVGDVKPPLVSMTRAEVEKLGRSLSELAPEIFSSEKVALVS